MNWRSIAVKLAAGEMHYALGRFYCVRRAYSVISGLRWPSSPPVAQAGSILKEGPEDAAIRSLHVDGVAFGFDLPAGIVAKIREYAERSQCYRSGDRRRFTFHDVTAGRLADGKPVVLGIVDNPRTCPEIDRLCADPTLLAALALLRDQRSATNVGDKAFTAQRLWILAAGAAHV